MSEKPDPSVPVDATVSLGEADLARTISDGGAETIRATPSGAVGTVGREFGTVRIKREIGRGATGVVYLGHDRVLGRDVALKALVNVAQGPEGASAAFLREARAAAAVRHPNLTQIHHADVAGGTTPYLVLEYVDGPSLAGLLKETGPLKPAVAVGVLLEVCAAVEELHEHDVVHRDLKPSNVLVNRDGGEVYVSDFGLAVKGSGLSSASPDGLVAGTPLYMAPEMFEGQVSPRSDIYALGVMAFEMMCGRVPFAGSLEEVRRKHAEETLPSDELRARGVGDELIDVVERATHKKAMFRYKTARELARALQQAATALEGSGSAAKIELRRLLIQHADRGAPTPTASDVPAASSRTATAAGQPAASSTSYLETLGQIAAAKREKRMRLMEPGVVVTPEPLVERRLEVDITCVQCGYDLRSLDGGAKCPECGKAVRDSLFRGRLIFADEQWLRMVTVGVTTIAYAAAATGLLFVVLQPVLIFALGGWRRGGEAGSVVTFINSLLAPLMTAVFLAGAFAATLKEPLSPSDAQPWVLRWVVRVAAILGCILTGVGALSPNLGLFGTRALRPLFEIPAFVSMGGTMLYLAWLAERVPDLKLAAQSRRRGWIVIGCGLLFVVAEMLFLFPLYRRFPRPFGMLPSLLILCLLALSVAMLWLTFRVRKVLRATMGGLVSPDAVFMPEAGGRA